MLLGDAVESALSTVGITKSRVEAWLGHCNCGDRQEKLNELHKWARRVILGRTDRASEYLNHLLGDSDE